MRSRSKMDKGSLFFVLPWEKEEQSLLPRTDEKAANVPLAGGSADSWREVRTGRDIKESISVCCVALMEQF